MMGMLWKGRLRYRRKQYSYAYHRLIRRARRIRCPACGSNIHRTITVQKPYWVEVCLNCGLGLTMPGRSTRFQEDEHVELYSQESYVANYLKNYAPYLQRAFKRGLERLSAYCPPHARLLDVGCGFGYFLDLAREAGYDVEGIEVSGVLCQTGAAQFSLRIRKGSVMDLDPEGCFDVLTAWDVLEHVVDVEGILRKFRHLLKPEGLILLRVPDFGFVQRDLPAGFFQRYMSQVFPLSINQHIHHFTEKSLRRLLQQSGYDVLECWPSEDDEYTPREIPDYAVLLAKMREYGISCEMNIIARAREV
jgi:2-polyprenyl-3-methyl-5-hydroxy-6-metoxy-1,4-benzoquinol methylase